MRDPCSAAIDARSDRPAVPLNAEELRAPSQLALWSAIASVDGRAIGNGRHGAAGDCTESGGPTHVLDAVSERNCRMPNLRKDLSECGELGNPHREQCGSSSRIDARPHGLERSLSEAISAASIFKDLKTSTAISFSLARLLSRSPCIRASSRDL